MLQTQLVTAASAGTARLMDLAQDKAQGDAAAAFQAKRGCTAATARCLQEILQPLGQMQPVLSSWHILLRLFW